MTWKVVPEAVAIQDSLKPDLTLVNETIDGIGVETTSERNASL